MKQIKITVSPSDNFTPAGLMTRWAKENKGAAFKRSRWGEALLQIGGTVYRYHHWSITAENGAEIVTLYLLEAETYQSLSTLCRTCTRLEKSCKGSTDRSYTGCAKYGRNV